MHPEPTRRKKKMRSPLLSVRRSAFSFLQADNPPSGFPEAGFQPELTIQHFDTSFFTYDKEDPFAG